MTKNWMTFINALRPAHRRAKRQHDTTATCQAPYDARMSDRFLPQLSTR